jgi:hypothetical protein
MSVPRGIGRVPALLRLGLGTVGLAALSAWSVGAAELAPGQTYAGGTRVEVPRLGVSFAIPAGWSGQTGQDPQSHAVVLGSGAIEGVGLASIQYGVTVADLVTALSEAQDLGAGIVLEPTGAPITQGSRIVMRYENERYVGRALAVVGPAQDGVLFFFAGPRKNERAYVALLDELAASTHVSEPAGTTAAPTVPATLPGPGQDWATLLGGQALHYFSSYNSGGGAGGTAAHRILHLCANGRFAYGGDSLVTMNVPGASGSSGGRDSFEGRWSLESPTRTTAVLVLDVDGGRQLRWEVRYDGTKTFLNGRRWLREPSKACR